MSYVQGNNGIVIPFSTNLDLTGATVTVDVKKRGNVISKTATILDAVKGNCEFNLLSSDLTSYGWYQYQWWANYTDGRLLSDTAVKIWVNQSLATGSVSGNGGGLNGGGGTTTVSGNAEKITYDSNGRVSQVQTLNGTFVLQTTTVNYDSNGNITSVADSMNGTSTINYDSNGNITSVTKG